MGLVNDLPSFANSYFKDLVVRKEGENNIKTTIWFSEGNVAGDLEIDVTENFNLTRSSQTIETKVENVGTFVEGVINNPMIVSVSGTLSTSQNQGDKVAILKRISDNKIPVQIFNKKTSTSFFNPRNSFDSIDNSYFYITSMSLADTPYLNSIDFTLTLREIKTFDVIISSAGTIIPFDNSSATDQVVDAGSAKTGDIIDTDGTVLTPETPEYQDFTESVNDASKTRETRQMESIAKFNSQTTGLLQ